MIERESDGRLSAKRPSLKETCACSHLASFTSKNALSLFLLSFLSYLFFSFYLFIVLSLTSSTPSPAAMERWRKRQALMTLVVAAPNLHARRPFATGRALPRGGGERLGNSKGDEQIAMLTHKGRRLEKVAPKMPPPIQAEASRGYLFIAQLRPKIHIPSHTRQARSVSLACLLERPLATRP